MMIAALFASSAANPGYAGAPAAVNAAGDGQEAAAGEELCVAGQKVEFVHLNRRWPGVVKGHSYGGDQCLVTSNMNTGSFMQDLEIDFADLRVFNGAPERGMPDVPGRASPASNAVSTTPGTRATDSRSNTSMVTTTPEEVLRIASRDHDLAVARYDGKFVRVTSLPGRIGISGNSMRLYADPSRYTASVLCLFEPERMSELRSVPDGAAVTVEGDANIAGAERINIQNCHVVAIGGQSAKAAIPSQPPMGKYICMQSGQGIGDLVLSRSSYTASGKTGFYSYSAGTGKFVFTSGNYAQWGWSGVWKTDSQSPGGVPEPRIDITDGGKLNIHCYPPK